jgi:hypothetical protein
MKAGLPSWDALWAGPSASEEASANPVDFTDERAQRLLTLVRSTLKTHGEGDANALGHVVVRQGRQRLRVRTRGGL